MTGLQSRLVFVLNEQRVKVSRMSEANVQAREAPPLLHLSCGQSPLCCSAPLWSNQPLLVLEGAFDPSGLVVQLCDGVEPRSGPAATQLAHRFHSNG